MEHPTRFMASFVIERQAPDAKLPMVESASADHERLGSMAYATFEAFEKDSASWSGEITNRYCRIWI